MKRSGTGEGRELDPTRLVYVIKSPFLNRKATVVFDYPPQCGLQSRLDARCVPLSSEELKSCSFSYKLCKKAHTYNCAVNSFKFAGFERTSTARYNVLIGGVPRRGRITQLRKYQKYNHFAGSWQLGRKDNLYRCVNKCRRTYGADYNICPYTFILPEDYKRFKLEQRVSRKSL